MGRSRSILRGETDTGETVIFGRSRLKRPPQQESGAQDLRDLGTEVMPVDGHVSGLVSGSVGPCDHAEV